MLAKNGTQPFPTLSADKPLGSNRWISGSKYPHRSRFNKDQYCTESVPGTRMMSFSKGLLSLSELTSLNYFQDSCTSLGYYKETKAGIYLVVDQSSHVSSGRGRGSRRYLIGQLSRDVMLHYEYS